MRGKGDNSLLSEGHCGITPAYAGKRLSLAQLLPVVKDHPRVCGEKFLAA